MEYKTYGDRAVKLEKWPISSFGMSINQSVTMISARDASASEKQIKRDAIASKKQIKS